jgi:acyl carrier protein
MQDQLATIREFVARHVGGAPVEDDEDIFASGYVNSLFAVQLVMFVERTFDIPVVGDDLDLRNFRSVAAVHRFVTSHDTDAVAA